jgi:hypothetical protein
MSDASGGTGERTSDRINTLLRKGLMDERELTKKELGELERGFKGHVDGVSSKIQQQVDQLGLSIKDVVDFVADQKKRQEDADKVKSNTNTIVVPPNDVKPVIPEDADQPPDPIDGGKPRRSWKDWF